MDQPRHAAPGRIELRQHRRCLVPSACLLSFAPFTPTISFGGDAEGEGVVLNLSLKGCKVHSDAEVNAGDAMSLIVLVPGEPCPTTIDLALVRWVGFPYFGLEFVSVGMTEANRLRQFLSSIRVSE
jgi:hypothetical protein